MTRKKSRQEFVPVDQEVDLTRNSSPQPPAISTAKTIALSDAAAAGLLAMLATLASVVYLVSPDGRIVGSDEAIFGHMAQMIASFKEFPVYCWEAHYAGAVVSYIAAVIFNFFGSGVTQLKCAMLPFAIGAPPVCYFVYKKMFGPFPAFMGALLIIFCPYFILEYKMTAIGGYGESLFGTALIILLSWRLADHRGKTGVQSLFLGLVSGFFFYILFLVAPAIAVFPLIALWFLKNNRIRNALLFCAGGIIGSIPLIVYNISTGGATLVRSISRTTRLDRADIHSSVGVMLSKTLENKLLFLKHWFSHVPALFGCYLMPGSPGSTATAIAGFAFVGILAFFLYNAYTAARSADRWSRRQRGEWQFALFFVALIGFVWIPTLDSPRHLMPLLIILPVVIYSIINKIAKRVVTKNILTMLFLVMGAINVWGWTGPLHKMKFDPIPVVKDMKEKNIRYFYASCWTTYPIVFSSGGTVLGSPKLISYGEPEGERRPQYTAAVRNSPNPAFFFAQSETALQNRFNDFLIRKNVVCDSSVSSSGVLFYNFSKPVDAIVERHWATDFVLRDTEMTSHKQPQTYR